MLGSTEASPESGWWGGGVAVQDGIMLLGLALLVTLLGIQLISRARQQPINNSVAGLVIGMLTGAIVFSDTWWYLFGYMSHKAITLSNEAFYNVLMPPIVFYAGFSVKKKLFFKNLVTIAIFGILGSNLTASVLSACLYPVLAQLQIGTHAPPNQPSATLPVPFNMPASIPEHTPLHTATPATAFSRALRVSEPLSSSVAHLDPHITFNVTSSSHDDRTESAGLPFSDFAAGDASFSRSEVEPDKGGPSKFPPTPPPPPAPSGPDGKGGGSAINASTLQQSVRLGTVFSSTDHFALLHSIDPGQQPVLHSLLFGEDVMNHITSIVMLQTFADLPDISAREIYPRVIAFMGCLLGSLAAGVGAGLLSALLVKHLFNHGHHHTDREVLVMALMAVMAFMGALRLNLSGIISVFFCGITMSHYTWHTISPTARVMSVHNFRVMASVCETFMFIYAGLDSSGKITARMTDLSNPQNQEFILTTLRLAAALLGLMAATRGVFVAVAVAVVNLWRRYKFTAREAFVLWYSGLVRGSITTCLVYAYFNVPGITPQSGSEQADDLEVILVAAVLVIVVSTVLLGGLSGAVMRGAALPPAETRLEEIRSLPTMNLVDDGASMNSAAVLSSKLHRIWRRFDRRIMKHFFGGRDSRAPNYLQSVSELNRTIARGQDPANAGALPVSSILPPLSVPTPTNGSHLSSNVGGYHTPLTSPLPHMLETNGDVSMSPQSTSSTVHLEDFEDTVERVPSSPYATPTSQLLSSSGPHFGSGSTSGHCSTAINGAINSVMNNMMRSSQLDSQVDLDLLTASPPRGGDSYASPVAFLGAKNSSSCGPNDRLPRASNESGVVPPHRPPPEWRSQSSMGVGGAPPTRRGTALTVDTLALRGSDASSRPSNGSSNEDAHELPSTTDVLQALDTQHAQCCESRSSSGTPTAPSTPLLGRILTRGATMNSCNVDTSSRNPTPDPPIARNITFHSENLAGAALLPTLTRPGATADAGMQKRLRALSLRTSTSHMTSTPTPNPSGPNPRPLHASPTRSSPGAVISGSAPAPPQQEAPPSTGLRHGAASSFSGTSRTGTPSDTPVGTPPAVTPPKSSATAQSNVSHASSGLQPQHKSLSVSAFIDTSSPPIQSPQQSDDPVHVAPPTQLPPPPTVLLSGMDSERVPSIACPSRQSSTSMMPTQSTTWRLPPAGPGRAGPPRAIAGSGAPNVPLASTPSRQAHGSGLPAASSVGMSSALSGAEDNLPAPYQPPDSFAGSDDEDAAPVDSQSFTPEDALLDVTNSFADLPIPWNRVSSENDRGAAQGDAIPERLA